MAKRAKGLSFDQKREKMLNIFHQTKDVFNMAEVEKLSMKAGIVLPSVKEVLDSLRADDLVNSDKIGAGNFFWSFPSKTHQILIEKVDQSKDKLKKLKQQRQALEKAVGQASIGRQDCPKRSNCIQQLEDLKKQQNSLQAQLQKFRRFRPQRLQLLKKQTNEMVKRGNFWTDNLYQIVKFLKKINVGLTDDALQEQYEIDPNMDYLNEM